MIKTVSVEGSTFQEGHAMLETGTPRIAEAIGWGAAVEWLDMHDMKEIHSHINRIASWTAEQISEIDGITVYGDSTRGDSSGAVSFLHESIQSQDLALLLDEGGFAVRTGHHCAASNGRSRSPIYQQSLLLALQHHGRGRSIRRAYEICSR